MTGEISTFRPVTLRVLGKVQLDVDGASVRIGRRRERIVLALLALRAPRPVSVGELRTLLLDIDDQTADVRLATQVCMSRLRRAVTPYGGAIAFANHAYTLDTGGMAVDAKRFLRLVADGAGETDPHCQATLLRRALALWRDEALAELHHLRAAFTAELVESRLFATYRLIELELGSGHPHEVIPRLRGIVAERPTDESFVGLLMTALSAAGRPAEAIEVYGMTRRRLAEELGVDPSRALTERYLYLLRQHTLPAPGLAVLGERGERQGASRAQVRNGLVTHAAASAGLPASPASTSTTTP